MEENNDQYQNIENQDCSVNNALPNNNMNNAINQSVSKNNNNNKILIILMALVIVGLVGYIVYTKFIEKEPDKPIENNTQESNNAPIDNNNNTQTETNLSQNEKPVAKDDNVDKNVYKTADGKHTLKVMSNKFIYDGKELKFENSSYTTHSNNIGKYIEFYDSNAQCGIYFFIVDSSNNTLVNFNYAYGKRFTVKQIGTNYYFIETDPCDFGHNYGVYTENMKKIGTAYIDKDDNNNFYVSDNGIIVKYDQNGNILKKSTGNYDVNKVVIWTEAEYQVPIVTNDNIYFMYYDNEDPQASYIFIDVMNNKEYKTDTKDYVIDKFYLNTTNNCIEIKFDLNTELCTNCDSDKEITYTFDLSTVNFTKK